MRCILWILPLIFPKAGSGCGSLMSASTSSVESHRSILQSKSTLLSPRSAINGAVFRLKRHSSLSQILCPPMVLSVSCRIYAIIYFALGFFNILFAWLGMIDFLLPLLLAIFGGNKYFCNHLCGRGQLFSKLGTDLKCSRCKPTPRWMSSKWFRYGFLLFFLMMFGNMVFQTYLVAAGAASLREAIKLFWTFRVPWGWTYTAGTVADWVAQFSFGFYSLMLTSLLLGLIVMVLYKPRTWCAFCPMGTMTQGICKLKNKES